MPALRPRAVLRLAPVLMSLLALAVVAERVWEFAGRPQLDEGWQAHIFLSLMAAQIPLIAVAAWVSRGRFRRHLPWLGAHVGLYATVAAAAWFLT